MDSGCIVGSGTDYMGRGHCGNWRKKELFPNKLLCPSTEKWKKKYFGIVIQRLKKIKEKVQLLVCTIHG